jgi:hypothetical protein
MGNTSAVRALETEIIYRHKCPFNISHSAAAVAELLRKLIVGNTSAITAAMQVYRQEKCSNSLYVESMPFRRYSTHRWALCTELAAVLKIWLG